MVRALLLRGAALALLWWVLSEGRADSWLVGGVSLGLALAASLALSPPGRPRLSLRGAAAFAGFFLVQSAQGGLQVARMALRPRLQLEPAMLVLPLTLPPGPLRILLVNTLNLLPGTVATRIDGDLLHLHVLDARLPIADEVRRVEARVAALLEPSP